MDSKVIIVLRLLEAGGTVCLGEGHEYVMENDVVWIKGKSYKTFDIENETPEDILLPASHLTLNGFIELCEELDEFKIKFIEEWLKSNTCPQCGNKYNKRACGPTHAIIANERGFK